MKVLIIESDSAFAQEASEALRQRGVETTIVEDGEKGMEAARAERPDALILSVELGDRPQAGFSICNRIKKDEVLKEIPLLLVSANATEEAFEQHRKLRTRADQYLRKPFALDPFLEAMEALLPAGFASDSLEAAAGSGGRTERFGWSGFKPASTPDASSMPALELEGEDEPLFGTAVGGDEDLDLDGLFTEREADWAAPVKAAAEPAAAPAPALETPPPLPVETSLPPPPAFDLAPEKPGPSAHELELARSERDAAQRELESTRSQLDTLRRELETTRAELEAAKRELETSRGELETARRQGSETRERLASVEFRLREALTAREEAERKVEELRRMAQNNAALQERLQGMQQAVSTRDSEILRLRQRLEHVEQVRQRTMKALKVAAELLRTIE